jgi:subtilisin family serine protease
VFVVVSAGNDATDAKDYSPASEPSACTVGAFSENDTLSWYSNYGYSVGALRSFSPLSHLTRQIDILAPSDNILSTWPDKQAAFDWDTSMSSPYVAGLRAYLLGQGLGSPFTMCKMIKARATKASITWLQPNTANLLAYNGAADV